MTFCKIICMDVANSLVTGEGGGAAGRYVPLEVFTPRSVAMDTKFEASMDRIITSAAVSCQLFPVDRGEWPTCFQLAHTDTRLVDADPASAPTNFIVRIIKLAVPFAFLGGVDVVFMPSFVGRSLGDVRRCVGRRALNALCRPIRSVLLWHCTVQLRLWQTSVEKQCVRKKPS